MMNNLCRPVGCHNYEFLNLISTTYQYYTIRISPVHHRSCMAHYVDYHGHTLNISIIIKQT